MAITTPAGIQITSTSGLMLPTMGKQPLQRALENLNYLWKFHRPPLVDVCLNPSTTRDYFVIPIMPSADGLDYTAVHRLMPTNTTTCNITIDYCTAYTGGGTTWHNLLNINPATTAATLLTRSDTITIPSTAVALRIYYDPAAGTIFPHHLLVYPSPGDAVAGIKAGSGFVPFDDGLLNGATGAPVHTEHLNRCKLSTLAVLRDRRQNCLSMVQRDSSDPLAKRTVESWGGLPVVRAFFPFQGDTVTIDLRVLADVSAGGTAGLIRVSQVGGQAVTFAANGAIQSDTLTLTLQGDGPLKYADIEIACKATTGHTTKPRAIMGFWRPTD